jgi:hypothetical protein
MCQLFETPKSSRLFWGQQSYAFGVFRLMKFSQVLACVLVLIAWGCATVPEKMQDSIRAARYDEALERARDYLASGDREHSVAVTRLADTAGYRKAQVSNTPESYQVYLQSFSWGRFRGAAMAARERLLFQRIQSSGESVEAYQALLEEFPSGGLATKVRERIQELSWESARALRSVSLVREFRRKFPDSSRDSEACLLEAELAWEELQSTATSYQLRLFMRRYPNSSLAKTAFDQAERLDWEEAEAAGTVQGWVRFMRRNPQSKRIPEAKQALRVFPWLERIRLEIAGKHSVDDMLLQCGDSGIFVINPWTKDSIQLSDLKVQDCEYSPEGQFLTAFEVVREPQEGEKEIWTLHALDLRSSQGLLPLADPSPIPLCLIGTENSHCNTSHGFIGRAGHIRVPDGRRIPLVGVRTGKIEFERGYSEAPCEYVIDRHSKIKSFSRKDVSDLKIRNATIIGELLGRVKFSVHARSQVTQVKTVEAWMESYETTVNVDLYRVPGGKYVGQFSLGIGEIDYVGYSLLTGMFMSLKEPKEQSKHIANNIGYESRLLVSHTGTAYYVETLGTYKDECDEFWQSYEGGSRWCTGGLVGFLGGTTDLSYELPGCGVY